MSDSWETDFAKIVSEDFMYSILTPNIQARINHGVFVFSKCRDALVHVIQQQEQNDFSSTLWALLHILSERNNSLIWLLQARFFWDSAIILRASMEISMKILYVCYCNDMDREKRITEFWYDLKDLRELKRHERIKNLENSSPVGFWLSQQLLSEEKEKELREKWPRAIRKRLEQRWSFFEMAAQIDKFVEENGGDPLLNQLFLEYGHYSHFAHGDEMSVLLTRDFIDREPKEQEMLLGRNACAILESYISCPFMILNAINYAYKLDNSYMKPLYSILDGFHQQNKIIHDTFYISQEELAQKIIKDNP